MKITMLAVSLALAIATTAAAEMTLFEHDNFNGRRFSQWFGQQPGRCRLQRQSVVGCRGQRDMAALR